MRGQLRCTLKYYYEWMDRTDARIRAVRVPPQPQMICKALNPEKVPVLVDVSRGWWSHGAAHGPLPRAQTFEIAKAEWERFDDRLEWYTVTGKRDETATLPVHPVLREEIEPHRKVRGYVFPGRKNVREHISPVTVWNWTRYVFESAKLEPKPPHTLRHTALTTALDNTENLRSVMEFARHSKPQTTAGYTRTTQAQLRGVSDALDYF